MLTRLYVDNYKRLVNFDYRPGQIQLLMGGNGSGKSSVFEVLARLRSFIVHGKETDRIFDGQTLTAWSGSMMQAIILEAILDSQVYRYSMVVDHSGFFSEIVEERLTRDEEPLFTFAKDVAQNHSHSDPKLRAPYSQSGNRSPLASAASTDEHSPIARFKNWMSSVICVAIHPNSLEAQSKQQSDYPGLRLGRFVGWFQKQMLEHPDDLEAARRDLQDVINGFRTITLQARGTRTWVLRVKLRAGDSTSGASRDIELDVNQLSDGQRALIVLYTLLHCAVRNGSTLCIDEPDNYVALPEIQPWLMSLQNRIDEQRSQVLIASHHPELLNQLAANYGQVFVIRGSGGVTVEPYKGLGTGLPPAEEVARGWDRG